MVGREIQRENVFALRENTGMENIVKLWAAKEANTGMGWLVSAK